MVLGVAATLLAVATALRYAVDAEPGPGDGIILLCVVPIALVAMEYGVVGGVLCALVAVADFTLWDLATDAGTPAVGYATRALTFLVLAVLVGRYAHGALAVYDPVRLRLLRELRRALERDELVLYYQPIAETRTRRVTSVEALVRWNHPERGLVPPNQFVPAIEGSSLLWDFTCQTLEMAVRQAGRWHALGVELPIAVNLSSSVLADPRLPAEVARLLRRHGVAASRLELEVTESAVMQNADASSAVLTELAELGVRLIALDDFGTGRSSLARLHRLPIDRVKIDRVFVSGVAADADHSVMEAIVALAAKLGLSTTAEGVEDARTWQLVTEMGCDTAQGFCLARPAPPEELSAWFAGRGAPVA